MPLLLKGRTSPRLFALNPPPAVEHVCSLAEGARKRRARRGRKGRANVDLPTRPARAGAHDPSLSSPLSSPAVLRSPDSSTRHMTTYANKQKQHEQAWEPPTPRSNFVPLPATTLPVDHLVLLPPPLIPHDDVNTTSTGTAAGLSRPTLPSLRATFDSPPPASTDASAVRQIDDDDWLPESSNAKRPRRSAAIAAARNLPRQPSPFDLEEDDPSVKEPSPSTSPPPTASASRGAGVAGSSKRKVSHSLIERRRREKINQCLQVLRETVPSLKEEGERKMARARERGRKRGRGDEAGERGGLHKLEILEVRVSVSKQEV